MVERPKLLAILTETNAALTPGGLKLPPSSGNGWAKLEPAGRAKLIQDVDDPSLHEPSPFAADDRAGRPHERSVLELRVVTLDEFVDVEEQGAEALLGDGEGALIPAGGDVMFYGDGGAGKTTLAIDLACHLAAGDAWLGVPVARPVNILLIKNEGPRPHFGQAAPEARKLGRIVTRRPDQRARRALVVAHARRRKPVGVVNPSWRSLVRPAGAAGCSQPPCGSVSVVSVSAVVRKR
jgi:AAA domain